METDPNKTIVMEQLRAAVLKEINLHEEINRRFRVIIYILIALLVVSIGTIAYLFSYTIPNTQDTLGYVKQLQDNIILQQRIQIQDREDIKIARENIIQMQKQLFLADTTLKKNNFYNHLK